jgi:hypothetical protein
MKNALLFSLGLLVIMSVALFMTPVYVLNPQYAAAGYTKCTVSTNCADSNPCTIDLCNGRVCSHQKYTGNTAGCSVGEDGMACFEGKCLTV